MSHTYIHTLHQHTTQQDGARATACMSTAAVHNNNNSSQPRLLDQGTKRIKQTRTFLTTMCHREEKTDGGTLTCEAAAAGD